VLSAFSKALKIKYLLTSINTSGAPPKIRFVKLCHIELWLAIEHITEPRPRPWMRIDNGAILLIPGVFQYPESDEVMVVAL